MEKRGFLVVLSLFLIKFVSAQFSFNSGGFSIGDFLNGLDPSTVTYFLLFLIFLTIINLVLSRISLFKKSDEQPNIVSSGIISFCLSALIVYYMYTSGYNFDSVISNLGFSGDLSTFLIIGFVIIALLMIWKFGITGFSMLLGLLLIVASFTSLVYESGISLIIGVVLFLFGLILWKRKSSRNSFKGAGQFARNTSQFVKKNYNWQAEKKQASSGWLWLFFGILLVILGIFLESYILDGVGIILILIILYRLGKNVKKPLDPAYQEYNQINA